MADTKTTADAEAKEKKTADTAIAEKPKTVAKDKEPPKEDLETPVEAPPKKAEKTPIKKPVKNSIRKPDGFCVYLGPSIRGVILSGAVFHGTKEQAIASLPDTVKEYPLIPRLIVSGETLAEDRIKVKTAGNLLNVLYKRLAAERIK